MLFDAESFPPDLKLRLRLLEVEPHRLTIRSSKGERRIPPKQMGVLTELAKRAPHIVARDELLEAVWPRGYVDPAVVGNAILGLRRALAAHDHVDLVETIPKRGYRLTCLSETPSLLHVRRGSDPGVIAAEIARRLDQGHDYLVVVASDR